jgi:hypothetical protein
MLLPLHAALQIDIGVSGKIIKDMKQIRNFNNMAYMERRKIISWVRKIDFTSSILSQLYSFDS